MRNIVMCENKFPAKNKVMPDDLERLPRKQRDNPEEIDSNHVVGSNHPIFNGQETHRMHLD
jgi:hypothetical protein